MPPTSESAHPKPVPKLEPRGEVRSFFQVDIHNAGACFEPNRQIWGVEGWAVGRLEGDFAGWGVLSSADKRW